MNERATGASMAGPLGGIIEAILILGILATMAMGLALATGGAPAGADPAFAAKGGKGANALLATSCTVDGTVVTATALPTDQVINFFVTTASGKTGWVLGWTDDGSWSEPVPAATGPTTYEFASRTWGPMGTHYTVFSSCSTG